ncbi:inositol polyphosphate kinase family protein [Emydomyces testavorans]|uniref:Kinase n=1 Tax=Emydomyces testavorans TaxID=2070801 RepID=A0AAF0DM14_9EURO|nr:inositol polyphosphate kinase family protein [Emydomyces testavorans]
MPEPSEPGRRKAAKLDGDSFVAFDHAAAGHDGVLCHADGSLIAKPCTQQEIAFYESSVHHPEFSRYMPTFMGTLAAAPDGAVSLSGKPDRQASITLVSNESSGTETPLTPEVSQHPGTIGIARSATQRENQWVPSGGRKLDTGLSIVLENVAGDFKRPSVLDVKLGARLWGDEAVPSKRAKLDEVSRQTTSSTLGFRIAGMKVWIGGENNCQAATEETLVEISDHIPADANDEVKSKMEIIEAAGYRRYDKYYGRAFNEHNIKRGIESFLAGAKAGKVDYSKLVSRRLAMELRAMQSMLEREESRMYSASILIVYEGDPEAFEQALVEERKTELESGQENDPEAERREDETMELASATAVDPQVAQELVSQSTINVEIGSEAVVGLGELDDDDEEEPKKVHDIRLIDFAHAKWTPGQGPDENALHGVRSLARILEELAEM